MVAVSDDDAASYASSLDSTVPASGIYTESWEPKMASHIASLAKATHDDEQRPFMVAVVGIPGSGKTVSTFLLAASMEEEHDIKAMVCPHDGYHYPIDYLKTFPNAEDAIYRRGAPDTFDPAALKRDLKRIKEGDEEMILVPAFDHAKGDPQPAKHAFDRHQHQVVLCEGLYLLHNDDGWEELQGMFDYTIFIDSNVDQCMERVKVRNQCIPGYTAEEIFARVDAVDRANAMMVLQSKDRADSVVQAVVSAVIPRSPRLLHGKQPSVVDGVALLDAIFVPSDLQLLAQKDVDEAETNDNADWTMDIMSRRSESIANFSAMRPRGESIVSYRSEPPPPPASAFVGSWEPAMADRIAKAVKERKSGKNTSSLAPYMVSLTGMPGGGKSVSSLLLTSLLDDRGISTMVCPHDGYHYPLDYLRTFPNAADYIYRRGAPDTFDPSALLRDLERIKNGHEDMIKIPAFDHATGDPEPDTHIFDRHQHDVVLCEGLYLLHDKDGWYDIANLFDLNLYMDNDLEICMERVKIRNQCIPGYTPEEIEVRCEKVDRVNAMTVLRSQARADVIVEAKPTPAPSKQ